MNSVPNTQMQRLKIFPMVSALYTGSLFCDLSKSYVLKDMNLIARKPVFSVYDKERLVPARSHTFVEIACEIISTVILLLIPSNESFKKGCCQLQAKVCARSTG